MEDSAHYGLTVALLGFALAFVFGAVANRSAFCTMGAVSDIVNIGDWGRMRMWLLAIAVAMLGANAMDALGWIDLSRVFYAAPMFPWLSYLVGGFLFGIGMTLASGCASKTLIRIGGGNLKSVVVALVLGISAYMTLKGLFGVWRVGILQPVAVNFERWGIPSQDLPALLTGGPAGDGVRFAVAAVVAAALTAFAFASRDFRADRELVFGGLVIGLLVAAGWYVTGVIGYRESPETLEMLWFGTNTRGMESLTFVAPVAYTLELAMLWSDRSLRLTFGIATVLGVVCGSLAWALWSGTFRWESFTSATDMRRHLLGAALMGFGGVTAFGCTIGQGVTGLSTLAAGSFVVFASICAGAATTMKYDYWRMTRE